MNEREADMMVWWEVNNGEGESKIRLDTRPLLIDQRCDCHAHDSFKSLFEERSIAAIILVLVHHDHGSTCSVGGHPLFPNQEKTVISKRLISDRLFFLPVVVQ